MRGVLACMRVQHAAIQGATPPLGVQVFPTCYVCGAGPITRAWLL